MKHLDLEIVMTQLSTLKQQQQQQHHHHHAKNEVSISSPSKLTDQKIAHADTQTSKQTKHYNNYSVFKYGFKFLIQISYLKCFSIQDLFDKFSNYSSFTGVMAILINDNMLLE